MRMRRNHAAAAAVMLVALGLAGCAPDAGPGGSPTATPSASPTASPTPSPTPQAAPLTLYYVVLGDNGASGEMIGCGDSLVASETDPVATDDPLRASMERLLADPERELGGTPSLYSAIPGGTLAYVSGEVDGGTVTVELTGAPAPAGECDNPRIETQLKRTAMAASGASEAVILVDGETIEDVLSLK